MSHPLVSIVTVSFNQARFLEEAISSVLEQDYPHIEYLVYDGGSTDGSAEIIARHSQRIGIVSIGPDGGPCAALNSAFRRSRGDILAYLNSDDVLLPGAVSRWVRELGEPDTDVVFGDIVVVDAQGRPSTLPGKSVSTFLAGPFSPMLYAAGASVIPQQASAWRRNVFQSVGGFEESNRTCWDKEFFADAAIRGFRFRRIPAVLARFRVHDTSISGTGRHQAARIADHARIDRKFRDAGIGVTQPVAAALRIYTGLFRATRHAGHFLAANSRAS